MSKIIEANKNTEEKIIKVATELFAKNGFDGTSTREICKLAGVNISLISYYFGGKKELYERVVGAIVENIINHMRLKLGLNLEGINFEEIPIAKKVELLYQILDLMIDYFYSDKVSDASIMILYREQMTSGVPVNAQGYKMFKKLLASILGRNEDDKEIIFRTLTIVGQIHSARVIKQFSLKMMNQSSYSDEDIQMLKQIIKGQVKAILSGLGVE